MGNRNYQFRPNNNLPAHYHPGLRNPENFSYSNPRNALNAPPPGFQGQSSSDYTMPVEKRASSLEENLNAFVNESRKRMEAYGKCFNSLEIHCPNMGASIKTLKTQIEQLAMAVKEQATRSLSNDAENNVRECKTIIVKSGT